MVLCTLRGKGDKTMAHVNVAIDAKKRRIGKFLLNNMFFHTEEGIALVQRIMGKCVITRAEQLFHSDGIEYVALCDEFDEITETWSVPHYSISVIKGTQHYDDEIVFTREKTCQST
jgi:hypothetical protein